MDRPARPLARPAALNELGRRALVLAEDRLSPQGLARLRGLLWSYRLYLYVTPGPVLVRQALAVFPEAVRRLGARCPFYRYAARSGGGYWPDRNQNEPGRATSGSATRSECTRAERLAGPEAAAIGEVWLAAGVETYEGTPQVVLSSRHEMFHFIAHNDPRYRPDDDAGWPALWGALEASRADLGRYPRYRDWIRGSFLPQGGHANPTELFADIPTNFPDPSELPPALRAYFGPLLGGGDGGPAAVSASAPGDLAAFHALIQVV